ncbi:MAG: TonB-dependent receptor [Pseudomonadota bacterium]|nr:TonB-dependent receptor [Pseudomonadota bacterium]
MKLSFKHLATAAVSLGVFSTPAFALESGATENGAESHATPSDESAPVADPASDNDLLNTPLEELLVIESTSVAKKRQNVEDSAAAVYVITQEEIRNSASSNIPDLLRSVPGVEVGQLINGGTAVSIRGFNGRNSNSLLVMVDGRTVYVSTLSGVFWDQLQIPLSDLERIEVVRGPGATLWGANAVNGVINIITKNSADTLGTRTDARIGNRRQEGSLAYGARLGETATLRAHGSYRREQGLQTADGVDLGTTQESGDVGLRVDWSPSERDNLTFQAGYKMGSFESQTLDIDPALMNPNPIPVNSPVEYEEVYALARWSRRQSDKLDLTLQAYAGNLNREELGFFDFGWSIADLDFGANWRPNETHDINFGFGVRAIWDEVNASNPNATFDKRKNTDTWISAYLQDDISLVKDTLRLTVGAKVERNNFTGFEFQPGARIFFRPDENVAIWGAVSRAVRTPSRFERGADLTLTVLSPQTEFNPTPLPIFPRLTGSQDIESENLTAFEAGFRADLGAGWNVDVAAYYNKYSELVEPTPVGFAPNLFPGTPFPFSFTQTSEFQSRGKAETWGFEAVLKGEVVSGWDAQLSYSNFNFDNEIDPLTGSPFLGFLPLNGSPEHQASVENTFKISDSILLNTELRYVDHLLDGKVPSYVDGDVRLRYEAPNGLEVSLIGENLFEDRRIEFLQLSYPAPPSFNPRSFSVELRYRF